MPLLAVFNSRLISFKPLDVNIVQVLNVQNFLGIWTQQSLNNVLQLIWVVCYIM